MIHGVESDWIEEEMADDDDFRYLNNIFVLEFNAVIRKDVLEQKVKKALEEIGFSKKVAYKVGFVDFSRKGHTPFWLRQELNESLCLCDRQAQSVKIKVFQSSYLLGLSQISLGSLSLSKHS